MSNEKKVLILSQELLNNKYTYYVVNNRIKGKFYCKIFHKYPTYSSSYDAFAWKFRCDTYHLRYYCEHKFCELYFPHNFHSAKTGKKYENIFYVQSGYLQAAGKPHIAILEIATAMPPYRPTTRDLYELHLCICENTYIHAESSARYSVGSG